MPQGLDLKGKTIIVTGATSGIGIPTATALARTGCSLVITARDPAKGQEALEAIRKDSGNGEVTVRALDLCSFESVKSHVGGFWVIFWSFQGWWHLSHQNRGIYPEDFYIFLLFEGGCLERI